VWIYLDGIIGKCLKTTSTCDELPVLVCEKFAKGSEGISGLNVVDSWCFVSGDGEEEGSSSCVSNEIFRGCNTVKNKHVCEDADVLFDIEYGCSWIKDLEGNEFCTDYGKSQKCSYYTTHKGCWRSDEASCSWVKVGGTYDCVVAGSGELCEHYVDMGGCTGTSEGDVCIWNSTLMKCLGVARSCEEYVSYTRCSAVNDRCFWNGNPSPSEGKCLSLEEMYTCEELSMVTCKNYNNVEGLSLYTEPCFYNYFSDVGGLYCTSVDSVTNTECKSIRTNKNVGVDSGPRYCDNAQFLFGISGKGFGCEWRVDTNECVDVLDGSNLPENCSEYETADSCNYRMIKSGSACFWNSIGDDENGTFCIGIEDIEGCGEICSNDVSGINSHFCDGNSVMTDSTSEMCRWGVVSEETGSQGCNCEGVEIPENCALLNASSPAECKQFISKRGKCFYNGDDKDDVMGVGVCWDVVDVSECSHLLNQKLCTYAKKHTYYNLENYTSASLASFLCLWNAEEEGICQSKKVDNSISSENPKISTWLLIVIIVVGVVTLVTIILVLILILKKMKSYSSHKEKEEEMTDIPKDFTHSANRFELFLCIFFSTLFISFYLNQL
jgi:hypothetical protein